MNYQPIQQPRIVSLYQIKYSESQNNGRKKVKFDNFGEKNGKIEESLDS